MKRYNRVFSLFLILVCLAGCDKPVDASKTTAAIDWLRNYYSEYPIGGGWLVTDISSESHYLNVFVMMQDQDATDIINLKVERQS